MKIGYVGLGNMGAALARRLQLQYPLFVYDLNEGAVARMVEKGSTACSSPRDVAAQCDVSCSVYPLPITCAQRFLERTGSSRPSSRAPS